MQKKAEREIAGKPSAKQGKRHYTPPKERGQSPEGGGWNLNQASEWCGIGVISLREMAKRREFPCLWVGRKCLVPREAFKEWFSSAAWFNSTETNKQK